MPEGPRHLPAVRRPVRPLVVLAVAATVALTGCSSKHGATAPTSTTPASTTTVAPTTTAPAAPTIGFPTNQAAADHLIGAWKANDRPGALQSATVDAVNTLFAVPVGSLNVRGCDSGEFDTSSCVYRLLSNQYELHIDLQKLPIGWIVSDISYTPPS